MKTNQREKKAERWGKDRGKFAQFYDKQQKGKLKNKHFIRNTFRFIQFKISKQRILVKCSD